MIPMLTKLVIYKKIYDWLKERIEGLLFLIISIFLVSYFHSEYLDYVEFKTKSPESNIGLSFVIKNILILLIALGYGYFYFIVKKTKQSIVKKEQSNNDHDPSEMVNSLDEFLDDDGISHMVEGGLSLKISYEMMPTNNSCRVFASIA